MPRSPERPEDFRRAGAPQRLLDVIVLPESLSPFSAKPEDFRRIRVRAVNDLDARMDLSVVKAGGRVLSVLPAGEVCREHQAAIARAAEQLDKVNVPVERVLPSWEA